MADHRTPFERADERTTLVQFLDYLRDCIVWKTEGLGEDDLRRALVPSGTSLLGLVKHLWLVEIWWFQWSFVGGDVELIDDALVAEDTETSVIAGYRAAARRSNAIIEACDDLDQLCVRNGSAPEPMSLRWLLVHMIEETARHAGHADILREQLDGETGR